MTKKQKLDLLVKIMTIFNNSFLVASFIVSAMIFPIGTISTAIIYLLIGMVLAWIYRKNQYFMLTLVGWLPAMCFQRVTEWISK